MVDDDPHFWIHDTGATPTPPDDFHCGYARSVVTLTLTLTP